MKPYVRDEVVKEFKFISKAMIDEKKDTMSKIFYYSAAYGAADRLLKMEFDSDLNIINSILFLSYRQLLDRAQAFAKGDRIIPIDNEIINKIAEGLNEIASSLEMDYSPYDALKKIMKYTFASTGPGHYMVLRGKLVLAEDKG